MGLAEYKVISKGDGWSDGAARNDYASKEVAFESAVAASLAIRERPRGDC